MPEMNGEFYVGYQPVAPAPIRRWIRIVTIGVLAAASFIALLLVAAQSPFADSKFEFGTFTRYRGRLVERPYPMLFANGSLYLLFGEGKRGLGTLAAGKDGHDVDLEGSLIANGETQAIEVRPDSLRFPGGGSPVAAPALQVLGRVTIAGEIVDTKCHLGVMNPGSGKVHRSCAARCLSGGVPPGLLVRDSSGKARTFLLAGVNGRDLLDLVAQPVRVSGELRRQGSVFILSIQGRAGIDPR